ncbi:MAG: tripartite tricarboxylate transporter permease [Bacillota bacterium]|jgi:putative tricarboxylic transport membrane protein
MDFSGLLNGFATALSTTNLFYAFIGSLLGTVVGILPGLGPTVTIAVLLPITYYMSPETAVIMIAAIYYGCMYGGSTTAILLNIPGEAASVVTAIDGYMMAKKGRAGAALGVAAIGSFIAAILSVLALTFLAPVLASFALKFGPPEYCALAVLGLVMAASLSGKSFIKGLIMVVLGMLAATIGQDPMTGNLRFTFGSQHLLDGIDFVVVAMGLFGVGELIANVEHIDAGSIVTTKIERIFPRIKDIVKSWWAIIRGTVIGFFIGILPGGSGTISSLASYAVEKRVSKHPEEFGQGAIEGVAGPESANNASSVASFVPLLTLGVPSNAIMAMLFAALLVHGITPGPFLVRDNPIVFWGLIASMFIGNVMLLILNLPLVGVWVQLLRVPFSLLAPIISGIIVVGVYTINNRVTDILIMVALGIFGYIMRKLDFELGPFLLAFVLEELFENSFRQSLMLSDGSPAIFFSRPISAALLGVALVFVITTAVSVIRRSKAKKRGAAIG